MVREHSQGDATSPKPKRVGDPIGRKDIVCQNGMICSGKRLRGSSVLMSCSDDKDRDTNRRSRSRAQRPSERVSPRCGINGPVGLPVIWSYDISESPGNTASERIRFNGVRRRIEGVGGWQKPNRQREPDPKEGDKYPGRAIPNIILRRHIPHSLCVLFGTC